MAPRVTGWDPRRNRQYHDIMFLLHKGGGGAGQDETAPEGRTERARPPGRT